MRYVLLNAGKNHQLVNMPIERNKFHPVEAITDRICTAITFETGTTVDEIALFPLVQEAWNGVLREVKLTVNDKEYFLIFVVE